MVGREGFEPSTAALPTELTTHWYNFEMVPEARLELARLERRGILNPLCLPIPPLGQIGAGNEARTRDPDLGKVVLYQLSYSRVCLLPNNGAYFTDLSYCVK